VIAAVLIGLVIAIPLYILRGPADETDEARELASPSTAKDPSKIIRTKLDAGTPEARVRLGPLQRVKCSSSRKARGNEGGLCDSLAPLEGDFQKAILANADCAPENDQEGTINYVLEVDFTDKQLHMFPGASGRWKGEQAKRATKCVLHSLPPVNWETMQHRYRYYMLAVLATYPAPNALQGLPKFK